MLCKKCGIEFKTYAHINGEVKNLGSRKFCLDCSPFGKHNTNDLTGVNKRRKSIIWSISPEEFKNIVMSSNSITEALRHFSLMNKGSNYKTFLKRAKEESVDLSHIYKNYNNRIYVNKKSNDEVFRTGSTHNRSHIKQRILKDNLIPYVCKCGLSGEWQGQKLNLQLDHINGIPNDNRLENLRFICPNCHSQTDTFAGKKANRTNKEEYKDSTLHGIRQEYKKNESIKKLRPSKLRDKVTKEQLEELISQFTYIEIGKMFDVSNNAIKKFARKLGIELPNRLGYWSKVKYEKL